MILVVLGALGVLTYFGQNTLLGALRYEDTPEYLGYLFAILALDALAAIPFARLGDKTKPFDSLE